MGQANSKHFMVSYRKFDFNRDYDTILSWWEKHCGFAPKPDHLSQNGIIVEANGMPICAGFLYQTDSAICVFEFVVCNPDAPKSAREEGLKALITAIQCSAYAMGYKLIYTSINIQAYIRKLKNAGFIELNTGMSHLFCSLEDEE